MPIYDYQCADCGHQDKRIAGVDDSIAVCTNCNGGIMLRLDEDLWKPYFQDESGAEVRP